jgi:hypothetical protein
MIKENRQEEIMQQHAKSGKFGKQTLQKIQEENRRLILEAIHGCSYEEALEKEKFKIGSLVKIKDDFRDEIYSFAGHSYVTTPYQGDIDYACLTSTDISGFSVMLAQLSEWYGKPLTLDRVLLAISNITNRNPFESSNDLINLKVKNCFIDWNLEKETLELQEESVQISINKLLTE